MVFPLLLFVVSLISFKFLSLYLSLIILSLSIFLILRSTGIFTSIQIYTSHINSGIIYVKDYQGSYKQIGKEIYILLCMLKKFNLENTYSIFCIDYDNPLDVKTDKSKCKASVGIYKEKTENFETDKEIENYAKENEMVSKMIPKTRSLRGDWKYGNFLAMIVGIKKFYLKIHEKLSDPKYCEEVNARKEEIKIAVEIYRPSGKINFNIPFENQEEFMLYKKGK